MIIAMRSEPTTGGGLDEIRSPLNRARHAPGFIYSSPEVYALEKQKLFFKDWLCVGRVEEVENPGDYMAMRIADEPVLVARNQDGGLGAFANVCAHRGVEVATGSGNASEFSCPYHGWRYDLDGRLIGAAFMNATQGFDPATCRLRPLRVAEWAGFVFVCFDADTAPLEEFGADFMREFGFLHPERCRLSGRIVIDFDCNWKLLAENVLDMYHAGTLHAQTFGAKTSYDDVEVKLMARGALRSDYLSVPLTPGGKTLFGKLPWLEDRPDNFATMGFMQPNTYIVARSDQVRMLISWPLAPDKSRGILYSLFPTEYFAEDDFAERARVYHEYLDYVLSEDKQMVQSLQHAMSIKGYTPGPMASLESCVHHIINAYLDRLFD